MADGVLGAASNVNPSFHRVHLVAEEGRHGGDAARLDDGRVEGLTAVTDHSVAGVKLVTTMGDTALEVPLLMVAQWTIKDPIKNSHKESAMSKPSS